MLEVTKETKEQVFDLVGEQPTEYAEIRRSAGFHPALVACSLMLLEMEGRIVKLPGDRYHCPYKRQEEG